MADDRTVRTLVFQDVSEADLVRRRTGRAASEEVEIARQIPAGKSYTFRIPATENINGKEVQVDFKRAAGSLTSKLNAKGKITFNKTIRVNAQTREVKVIHIGSDLAQQPHVPIRDGSEVV